MSGAASLVSCAISLNLTLGDFYALCCRPERLREPGIKNISREPPGFHAGIARESSGNPWCWKSLMFPNFQSLVQSCCSFAYEGLTLLNPVTESWSRSPVHYLPFKSAKLLEVDLRPRLKQPVVLHQRQLVGWSHLMAGYSGVLWPGSLLLSKHFAVTEGPRRKRCIELAAGRFALPSIALAASRCARMLATDLPGVVELELAQKYTEWANGASNLEVGSLDLCDHTDHTALGCFDLIVSSEGALQSPCGLQALLSLSTRDTELHLVLRGDAAEVPKQRFLLRNAFLEESRVDLMGKHQPSPPFPAMKYVVWIRTLGPRTCWDEDFTYAECCEEATGLCFDQVHTRRECCGTKKLLAN